MAAIVEVAIEHFIDQPLSADHGDAFELGEHHGLGLPRAFLRGPQLGPALAFDRLQLPVQQAKPLVLAHDLLLQLLRQRPPVAGAQLLEALEVRANGRVAVDRDQLATALQVGGEQGRVAAGAERRVDDGLSGAHGERLAHLRCENGNVVSRAGSQDVRQHPPHSLPLP